MTDILPLIGLALVDSLSAGTLVIPLALMIVWRRVRVNLLLTYLGTIAGAYCALGVAILFGFNLIDTLSAQVSQAKWFPWITLVLGTVLLIFGVFSPSPVKPDSTAMNTKQPAPVPASSGEARPGTTEMGDGEVPSNLATRLTKGVSSGATGMVGLALGAAVIEAATMLPYLAAMGIVQTMDLTDMARMGLVASYCIVMILPALVIGIIVAVTGDKMFARLHRVMVRAQYEAKVTLLWIAAIVGFYMAAASAARLGLLG